MKKNQLKAMLMLLGICPIVFCEVLPETYVTDASVKALIIKNFDASAFDNICKNYPAEYNNIKIREYTPNFAITSPASAVIRSRKVDKQYVGKNTLSNNSNVNQLVNSSVYSYAMSSMKSTTTTKGWSLSDKISVGEGAASLYLNELSTTVTYSYSIAETVTDTQNYTYSSPAQSILIPANSSANIVVSLDIVTLDGYYVFDADVTGTAVISYDASCHGQTYTRFAYGPIAGFLYYNSRRYPLPDGLVFTGSPDRGDLKLRVHSGGTFNVTQGTDFVVDVNTSPVINGAKKHSSVVNTKTLRVSPIIKANKTRSKLDSSVPQIMSPPKALFNLAPLLFNSGH